MTDTERAQVLVTARLLEAARSIDWLSTGLTLLAPVLLALTPYAVVSLVLGAVSKLYAVRVAFDAKLLHDIATDRLSTADLDAALGRTGQERGWPDRCRGARWLMFVQAAVTIAQLAAVALVAFRV
jgi:hypothetical protein